VTAVNSLHVHFLVGTVIFLQIGNLL